ncbi:MAG: hypothetical protein AAF791_12825 [Bacteroidota bacterium]
MVLGFVFESHQGGTDRDVWTEGAIEKSFWTGLKTKGRRRFFVDAFRCEHCGAVRMYALDPKRK